MPLSDLTYISSSTTSKYKLFDNQQIGCFSLLNKILVFKIACGIDFFFSSAYAKYILPERSFSEVYNIHHKSTLPAGARAGKMCLVFSNGAPIHNGYGLGTF